VLNTLAAAIANTGTLEAKSGGTLEIDSNVTNTGGLIQAGIASTVELQNDTITSGTVALNGTASTLDPTQTATLGVEGTVTLSSTTTTTLSNSINNLITEFLSFAKPTPPVLAPLRVIDVVRRVAEFCEPELGRQNIALTVRDEAPGAMVEGDQDQLYQVSLNLILNALDAMPSGGALDVRLFRTAGQLGVAFSDSGPGVPDDLRERVFNPFFTTKPHGTGLGLAKAFAILESHRGTIECSRSAAGGAMFTLLLPLSNAGRGA